MMHFFILNLLTYIHYKFIFTLQSRCKIFFMDDILIRYIFRNQKSTKEHPVHVLPFRINCMETRYH